ncbi:MAG: hypothetical protein Alis3KO_31800 [Aliiglaciecola sp.]
MKFASHGHLKAEKLGNILLIEGTGPWNIEMLESAGDSAKSILDELYKAPWGVLCIMHGDTAYLPDAAKKLTYIVKQEKLKNRKATAVVVADANLPSFAKGHLGQIYDQAGEHYRFFDDKADALEWLNGQF